MQKPLLSIALIISLQSVVYSQWTTKNIITSSTLSCVDFVTDELGFVTGDNKVYKTVNGGNSWTACFAASNLIYFEDVYAIDQNHVLAVGLDFNNGKSVMVKTNNGGNNWQAVTLPDDSAFLKSLFFVNSTLGFCSGAGGLVLKTTDGGDSWQLLNSVSNDNLESIFFVNEELGFAVGGSPASSTIIKTLDGGVHWTHLVAPLKNNFQSACFTDEKTGYVVGWDGAILKTEDAGDQWFIQNSVAMTGNLEVEFTDKSTGYIVGGSANETLIQKTTTGGDLWVDISPQLSEGLTSISFPSFYVGYAVGKDGTVLKTTSGGVLTAVSNPEFSGAFEVFPNPTSGMLNVISKSNSAIAHMRVYDNNGRVIVDQQTGSATSAIDLSDLEPGVYYLEISSKETQSIIRLVKR